MKKRDLIIKILIIVIILSIIGLTIFKFVNKGKSSNPPLEPGVELPSEEYIASFENKLREMIDSINFISGVFVDTNLSETETYMNTKSNEKCRKYIGENADMMINVIETIYDNPFSEEKTFNIYSSENGNALYVCKPMSCTVEEIKTDEIVVVDSENEDYKKIRIGEKEYDFKKNNDIWRFNEPVINCKTEE